MPINGLSENVRMPRLGKIRLGKRDPQRGFPIKTDYFVLQADHSNYKDMIKLFGEQPKELRVQIPVEDTEKWAPQYYKAYDMTHGLVCKGDGQSAMRMVDIKTNALASKTSQTVNLVEYECKGKECPEYKSKKCGEAMNLFFMLPEVPGVGVWQIDTGSINSILNINSCARIIKAAFGRIAMIPLKLTLEPMQVNNPESGKKQTVYVLHLRTNMTLAQLAADARSQDKLLRLDMPNLEKVYDDNVQRDIDELWGQIPGGSQKVIEGEPAAEARPPEADKQASEAKEDTETNKPLTLGKVLTWVASKGKQYDRAWFFKNQTFFKAGEVPTEKQLEQAMTDICSMTGWKGFNN